MADAASTEAGATCNLKGQRFMRMPYNARCIWSTQCNNCSSCSFERMCRRLGVCGSGSVTTSVWQSQRAAECPLSMWPTVSRCMQCCMLVRPGERHQPVLAAVCVCVYVCVCECVCVCAIVCAADSGSVKTSGWQWQRAAVCVVVVWQSQCDCVHAYHI